MFVFSGNFNSKLDYCLKFWFEGLSGAIIITYNNFEISLVVFMLNITTNHAITYSNCVKKESIFVLEYLLFLCFLSIISTGIKMISI